MNDALLKELLSEVKNTRSEMNLRFDEVNERLGRVEKKVDRIEENIPADILALLKNINDKLEDRDSEVQALNKRVFKTESTLERLTKQ
jgi:predicted  nucleic acid-binding Zn-ribbon protein